MKTIKNYLKSQLFFILIKNKLSHLLISTAERWIYLIQLRSYLSEIIENSYLISPQTPCHIKSYFSESSRQN